MFELARKNAGYRISWEWWYNWNYTLGNNEFLFLVKFKILQCVIRKKKLFKLFVLKYIFEHFYFQKIERTGKKGILTQILIKYQTYEEYESKLLCNVTIFYFTILGELIYQL